MILLDLQVTHLLLLDVSCNKWCKDKPKQMYRHAWLTRTRPCTANCPFCLAWVLLAVIHPGGQARHCIQQLKTPQACFVLPQDTVDSFKKTMPLIMDLRNPAMRPRHWANLMEVVGSKFDPAGPTFTLDSVVKLHLDQHADLIADLSGNASKELAIEMSIQVVHTCLPAKQLH